MRKHNLVLWLLFLAAIPIAAAQVKLEPAGPLTDASPEIVKAVAPEGQRVVLRNGQVLCEIWLVTSPPAPAKLKDTEHTNYSGALAPGEFVGVIRFPQGATDFRGQAIKPGAYSLRYELMANDGNHMGVAPERDFLLLVPLANETGTAMMTWGGLLTASSAASGTSHPAVFLLLAPRAVRKTPTLSPANPAGDMGGPTTGGDKGGPTSRNRGGPSVYESLEGYVVFAGKAGNVSLALVVKGQAEQ